MDQMYKLYNDVFNENGEIKACGRDKCKKLIIACETYYKFHYNENVNFGNSDTGFMNVDNIKKLFKNKGAQL